MESTDSTWDLGTDKFKKPPRRLVVARPAVLRRAGCGRLVMKIFAGTFILTMLATAAGWLCSKPIDILHDGLDLTREADRRIVDAAAVLPKVPVLAHASSRLGRAAPEPQSMRA